MNEGGSKQKRLTHTVEKTTQGMAKRPLKSQMAIMVETTHRFELRARSGHTMALYLKCNAMR